MLTRNELCARVSYDPETGEFAWLGKLNSNAKRKAGWMTRYGYWAFKCGDRIYMAHRLAFLYMTGEFPRDQIDHINGVRHDNRWGNLREVTQRLNNQNIRKAKRSEE